MKPPGKWIDGLEPGMPLADAARMVLDVRLVAVETLLAPAAHHAGDDVEHVHRLRVATRRAGAALVIFGDCLAPRQATKATRRLKKIRRAASAARECDVHRAQLTRLDGAPGPAIDALVRTLDSERRRAQESIKAVARRYPPAVLGPRRAKLLAAVRPPASSGRPGGAAPSLADGCRSAMPEVIDSMRHAAAADLGIYDRLHELRIAAKRMRYTLEVFASCIGDRFKTIYKPIETLQEALGDINDAHELLGRVEHDLSSVPVDDGLADALGATRDILRRRRQQRVTSFLASWNRGGHDALFASLDGLLSVLLSPDRTVNIVTFPTGAARVKDVP